jgi:uncharacterized membrane protein YqhA
MGYIFLGKGTSLAVVVGIFGGLFVLVDVVAVHVWATVHVWEFAERSLIMMPLALLILLLIVLVLACSQFSAYQIFLSSPHQV